MKNTVIYLADSLLELLKCYQKQKYGQYDNLEARNYRELNNLILFLQENNIYSVEDLKEFRVK